ncbi:Short-chain dehydrogenase [Cohaesibacter sp. ES.047]|uniref:SDR family NAD(P)-dependent oxidoreductase n=1 Tax=Cohaesibacter sp. ES.047 TaxID=1798205 RepID=UPI000BC0D41A|nr:SDR family NAD(P)-dependent oxidoreductase [Cohaesibacter sp. ES.047]SNY94244.1 Short-chain dehydrogenase [Cohaesibacter sp. ES.047]
MSESIEEKWKRVWIVGASSGIGRELCSRFAERGMDVFASARSEEALNELAATSEHISAMPLDVTDPSATQAAIQTMQDQDGLPDLTIYCAAIYEPGGIDALSHDAASKHMMVNYLGAVGVISGLVPFLKQRGRGDIAIISSLTSYCGLPLASLYGPTKAALASLCETLRPEFDRDGLGLRLINPGFVDTGLTEKNTFKMPFLISPDEAASRIVKGLEGRGFEIAFPFRMAISLRILRLLPYGLYFRLMRRLV